MKKNYKQLVGRHGAGFIRHLMEQFRSQGVAAAAELDLSPRRFRQLHQSYLAAAAKKEEANWRPGRSGGNRRRMIPEEVAEL